MASRPSQELHDRTSIQAIVERPAYSGFTFTYLNMQFISPLRAPCSTRSLFAPSSARFFMVAWQLSLVLYTRGGWMGACHTQKC